jgi:Protein of unknown function (DUF2752)
MSNSDSPPHTTLNPSPPSSLAPAVPVLQEAPIPISLPAETQAAHKRLAIRLWCSFIFTISGSMMAVGFWLQPDPRGIGSHQQLHLPPCGFYEATGYPCPTCGCTTAVSHFAHGHILASLLTQPFGFAVALLATLLIPLALIGIITGKWKGPSTFWLSWYWPTWVFSFVGILLAGWIYKVIVIRAHLGW